MQLPGPVVSCHSVARGSPVSSCDGNHPILPIPHWFGCPFLRHVGPHPISSSRLHPLLTPSVFFPSQASNSRFQDSLPSTAPGPPMHVKGHFHHHPPQCSHSPLTACPYSAALLRLSGGFQAPRGAHPSAGDLAAFLGLSVPRNKQLQRHHPLPGIWEELTWLQPIAGNQPSTTTAALQPAAPGASLDQTGPLGGEMATFRPGAEQEAVIPSSTRIQRLGHDKSIAVNPSAARLHTEEPIQGARGVHMLLLLHMPCSEHQAPFPPWHRALPQPISKASPARMPLVLVNSMCPALLSYAHGITQPISRLSPTST